MPNGDTGLPPGGVIEGDTLSDVDKQLLMTREERADYQAAKQAEKEAEAAAAAAAEAEAGRQAGLQAARDAADRRKAQKQRVLEDAEAAKSQIADKEAAADEEAAVFKSRGTTGTGTPEEAETTEITLKGVEGAEFPVYGRSQGGVITLPIRVDTPADDVARLYEFAYRVFEDDTGSDVSLDGKTNGTGYWFFRKKDSEEPFVAYPVAYDRDSNWDVRVLKKDGETPDWNASIEKAFTLNTSGAVIKGFRHFGYRFDSVSGKWTRSLTWRRLRVVQRRVSRSARRRLRRSHRKLVAAWLSSQSRKTIQNSTSSTYTRLRLQISGALR